MCMCIKDSFRFCLEFCFAGDNTLSTDDHFRGNALTMEANLVSHEPGGVIDTSSTWQRAATNA